MVNADKNPTETRSSMPETQASEITADSKNKQARCPFKWLNSLLTMIALIAAVYAIVMNYQTRHALGSQSIKLQNDFRQLQTTSQNDSDLGRQLQSNMTQMQNEITALGKTIHSILPQHLYQQQDWLLLKVRYFLELAQINAHWSDDKATTTALLEQASSLLANISNQRAFKIRQTIANEIALLKALPAIDSAGLLSQLDAAQNNIAILPIKHIPALNTNENKPAAPNNNATYWDKKIEETSNLLEKLVIIRHNETPIQPLLSPMHELLIRDSLKMDLQQAQWAVLQKNIPVYQLSLSQALTNLNKYFDTNAPATKAMIESLSQLQGEIIKHKQPAIQDSLQMIIEWIDANNTALNPVSTEGETKP